MYGRKEGTWSLNHSLHCTLWPYWLFVFAFGAHAVKRNSTQKMSSTQLLKILMTRKRLQMPWRTVRWRTNWSCPDQDSKAMGRTWTSIQIMAKTYLRLHRPSSTRGKYMSGLYDVGAVGFSPYQPSIIQECFTSGPHTFCDRRCVCFAWHGLSFYLN